VIAETPSHEPVISLGRDRLVLRQADNQFWAALTCPSCGVDMASVDLAAHRSRRPGAVLRTASERVTAAGTNTEVPLRPHRRDELDNRSSARVFGQKPVSPAGDLALLAMAIVAVVVVVVVVLHSNP